MTPRHRSHTAEAAAALRAIHSLHHDEPRVFDDQFALLLISDSWRQIICNQWAYKALNWATIMDWTLEVAGEVVGRQRFAEDAMDAAVAAGAEQIVLLGAGLDSLALRRPELTERVVIFEVDSPATQSWKKERVISAVGALPASVKFVPHNLAVDTLARALTRHGFVAGKRTFISWLGVSYYLPEDAVLDVLRTLATLCGKGSEIVLDYVDSGLQETYATSHTIARLKAFAAFRDEALQTSFDQSEFTRELAVRGLEFIESLDPNAQRERYFVGRTDGLAPLPIIRFGHLRVVGDDE